MCVIEDTCVGGGAGGSEGPEILVDIAKDAAAEQAGGRNVEKVSLFPRRAGGTCD